MRKGKIVFLFGAGATLPWGSPLTSELTTLIKKSGFKTCDNKTFITDFICKRLIENGYNEKEVNFEMIINVIDELIIYYSRFENSKNLPSNAQCFLSAKSLDEIFNFSIDGREIKHGYKLQIPKGREYDFSRQSLHNETPEQFFLQHLLAYLVTQINARISKYSYHTKGNSVIDKKNDVSKKFCNWMKVLENDNALRIYTLNYDRLFKILLENIGINVFEGFHCGEYIEPSHFIRADIRKIMTDSDCNVHYNLHGSVFWQVEPYDIGQLPNPEFLLTGAPSLPVNSDHALFQIEKGKNIMFTNIVTGYQKAERTIVTPFKQMHAAFDRDCCFADKIYIIGYSLGDEHINESIKTAIRHNSKVKIIFVDPYFIKNDLDFQMATKFFTFTQKPFVPPKTIADNLHSFYGDLFTLHTIGFEEFLEPQSNFSNQFLSKP